jgi:molecular chaperone DnaJ
MATDYYAVLGVDRDATTEDIKKAFRQVARATHPDANPGDHAAEARFREAAEAYEVLSDPERRRRYDRGDVIDLGDLLGGFGGIDDLLRSVFGDGGLFGTPANRPARGRDVLIRVDVELSEAAFGTDAAVAFSTRDTCDVCGGTGAEPESGSVTCPDCEGAGQVRAARRSLFGTMMTVTTCPTCRGDGLLIARPCESCGGTGSNVGEASLSVEIPGGVTTGTRLRLSGKGESGGRMGPPGDLFVEVNVLPDPRFERHNGDLLHRLTIDITAAALGTHADIPLIEGGTTTLEIRAGTQPGAVFTIPGHGMTLLGRRRRGDLHVEVSVKVPDDLTTEEEELLQKLAELRGARTNRPASAG